MLIYIAGKYSAPTREEVQANIDAAERAGKLVLKNGDVPIIPHRITGHWDFDPAFDPEEWSHTAWMERFCIPLLDRCDAILLLPGWKDSKGTVQEFLHASKTNKPVYQLEGISGK